MSVFSTLMLNDFLINISHANISIKLISYNFLFFKKNDVYYILVRLQTPSYYRKSTEVLLKSTHLCVNVCVERGGVEN